LVSTSSLTMTLISSFRYDFHRNSSVQHIDSTQFSFNNSVSVLLKYSDGNISDDARKIDPGDICRRHKPPWMGDTLNILSSITSHRLNGSRPNCSVSFDSDDVTVTGRHPWALFLLLFPLRTVFGNVLVCLSVYKERSLQTLTN